MAAPMQRSVNVLQLLAYACAREQAVLNRCILSSHVIRNRSHSSKPPDEITGIRQDNKIVNPQSNSKPVNKAQKISRAMRAYLEKAKKYESVLEEQTVLYELGRRHLANIMGQDPTNFSVDDMTKAVQYLLPSGLHEKKARPVIKTPIDLLPMQKVARFGSDGRPFSPMFYTGKPQFYETLYDITLRLQKLKEREDELARAGKFNDIYANKMRFIDSDWVKFDKFKKIIKEEALSEDNYAEFQKNMQRLIDHPLNHLEESYIMMFRDKFTSSGTKRDVYEIHELEDGTKYVIAQGGRKTSKAEVKVTVPGTGKFTCNGESILYFPKIADREQVLFPLELTGMLGEVDIEAMVENGGHTGQAGAVRLGISRGLVNFVDDEIVERMRLAGLLTRDPRMRERKKPFKKGARKSFTWKKR